MRPAGPSGKGGRFRVLIVEDNKIAADQLRTALEDAGYEVAVTKNGGEALERVKRAVPDLIVLDLMMPDIDGFEVLESLRSTTRTRELPVLILSAKELTPDDRARLTYNNVSEFIQKGALNRDELIAHVDAILKRPVEKKGGRAAAELAELVLIVEDNPDNLKTIQAILNQAGFPHISARDGQEGVKAARKARPRVILMDMQLPKMSGYEASRRIMADPALAGTSIIGVSAKAMPQDREKALDAGCVAYLSKPINPAELSAAVKKWII